MTRSKILETTCLVIEWFRTDQEEHYIAEYYLNIPLDHHDIRRTKKKTSLKLKFGKTTIQTNNTLHPLNRFDKTMDTPYRDGAHMMWDSEKLGGLPMYVIFGDIVRKIKNVRKKK